MGKKPRILVADDDPLVRRFLVESLDAIEAEVVAVASGAAVLAAVPGGRFDVLIADLRMPGPAGIELAHAVRDLAPADRIRLFAMSGQLDARERLQLRAAGYADAFQKPIPRSELAALLGIESESAPRAGPETASSPDRVLDDEAARAALGNDATVAAMRGLMLQDLAAQREALCRDLSEGRRDAALDLLHRLRAACGFCGTPRLAAASIALQRALERGEGTFEELLRAWERSLEEVRAALAQR